MFSAKICLFRDRVGQRRQCMMLLRDCLAAAEYDAAML